MGEDDRRAPAKSVNEDALHPVVVAAGVEAVLPDWARCGEDRVAHVVRVGDLLARWAGELALPRLETVRWRAAGVLHDALKDAAADELRALAGAEWPEPVAHAPACAARLRLDGVQDGSLLAAIAFHPVGHPDLDDLGEYLILADYLEPGRDFDNEERASLRERLPVERREVLAEVLARRMEKVLARRRPLMSCTVELWNRVVEP